MADIPSHSQNRAEVVATISDIDDSVKGLAMSFKERVKLFTCDCRTFSERHRGGSSSTDLCTC